MKKFLVLIVLFTMMIIAMPAMAQTVYDTYGGTTNTTFGWRATAQTITAPADNILMDYRWSLAARTSPGNVRFAVYEWGTNAPTGPVLHETVLPWSADGNYEVTGMNLVLTEGVLYGMVIDLLGYSGSSVRYGSNLYPGGNGLWTQDANSGSWYNYSSYDHTFRAVFIGNEPPTADAGGPYLVAVGANVSFDGTGSSDPDGDSLTETWTAGGGTVVGNVYTAGTVPESTMCS